MLFCTSISISFAQNESVGDGRDACELMQGIVSKSIDKTTAIRLIPVPCDTRYTGRKSNSLCDFSGLVSAFTIVDGNRKIIGLQVCEEFFTGLKVDSAGVSDVALSLETYDTSIIMGIINNNFESLDFSSLTPSQCDIISTCVGGNTSIDVSHTQNINGTTTVETCVTIGGIESCDTTIIQTTINTSTFQSGDTTFLVTWINGVPADTTINYITESAINTPFQNNCNIPATNVSDALCYLQNQIGIQSVIPNATGDTIIITDNTGATFPFAISDGAASCPSFKLFAEDSIDSLIICSTCTGVDTTCVTILKKECTTLSAGMADCSDPVVSHSGNTISSLDDLICSIPNGQSTVADCETDSLVVITNCMSRKVAKTDLSLFRIEGTTPNGTGSAEMTACDTMRFFSSTNTNYIIVAQGSGLVDINTYFRSYSPTVTLTDDTDTQGSVSEICAAATTNNYSAGSLVSVQGYVVRVETNGTCTLVEKPSQNIELTKCPVAINDYQLTSPNTIVTFDICFNDAIYDEPVSTVLLKAGTQKGAGTFTNNFDCTISFQGTENDTIQYCIVDADGDTSNVAEIIVQICEDEKIGCCSISQGTYDYVRANNPDWSMTSTVGTGANPIITTLSHTNGFSMTYEHWLTGVVPVSSIAILYGYFNFLLGDADIVRTVIREVKIPVDENGCSLLYGIKFVGGDFDKSSGDGITISDPSTLYTFVNPANWTFLDPVSALPETENENVDFFVFQKGDDENNIKADFSISSLTAQNGAIILSPWVGFVETAAQYQKCDGAIYYIDKDGNEATCQ